VASRACNRQNWRTATGGWGWLAIIVLVILAVAALWWSFARNDTEATNVPKPDVPLSTAGARSP
jgi:lipopolysaccharide export system protein LptC